MTIRRGTTTGSEEYPSHTGLDVMGTFRAVLRQLLQRISFGDPQGGGANGVLVNMEGSWVELVVTDITVAQPCAHNMTLPLTVGFVRPNVRWFVVCYEHDDTVAAGNAYDLPFIIYRKTGDAMTADSISLRVACAPNRTIDGDHPLRITLFFTQVSQIA